MPVARYALGDHLAWPVIGGWFGGDAGVSAFQLLQLGDMGGQDCQLVGVALNLLSLLQHQCPDKGRGSLPDRLGKNSGYSDHLGQSLPEIQSHINSMSRDAALATACLTREQIHYLKSPRS